MDKSERSKKYFDDTNRYLRSNPIIKLRKEIIHNLTGDIKGKNIIDIGCGNGDVSRDFLGSNKVTFLDISSNMLAEAKNRTENRLIPSATFINSDIYNFKTNSQFDISICMGLLAHVEDISAFALRLKEVTAPNGIIFLQFTAASHPISLFNQLRYKINSNDSYNYSVNLTRTSQIKRMLKRMGFKITRETRYLPISPLFSLFSERKKESLVLLSYKNKLISLLGSEVILTIVKDK
jgi:ubiquinone/menaquinone biosynthesis C-methylase UbiE